MKPQVKLISEEGNAYAIIGRCKRTSRYATWSAEKWKKYHEKATSSDYDILLRIVVKNFEVDSK